MTAASVLLLLLAAACSAQAWSEPAQQAGAAPRVGYAVTLTSPAGAEHLPAAPTELVEPLTQPTSPHTGRVLTAISWRAAMLRLVNAARARAGVPALCLNSKLTAAAQAHARDQAAMRRMSHTGSNGSTMSSRINAQGYDWNAIGENVAWGYTSVRAVFDGW